MAQVGVQCHRWHGIAVGKIASSSLTTSKCFIFIARGGDQ